MLALILIFLICVLIYYVIIKPYNYWKELNVPYLKPWPLVGNFGPNVFQQMNIVDNLNHIVKSAGNRRYIGIYQFSQPILLIRDIDLIKQLTVKEFDTFPDHRTFGAGENDTLVSRGLFSLTREQGWQKMRATLSPSFTSSKMKMMFTLMQECAEKLVEYYLEKDENLITVEFKDSMSRVASDIIATTAFGINADSLKNPENEVFLRGLSFTSFTGFRSVLFFLAATNPNLLRFLKLGMIRREDDAFYRNLILGTIKYREENKVVRPDMLQMLMGLKKGLQEDAAEDDIIDTGFAVARETNWGDKKKEVMVKLTEDDLVAQCVIFLFAGFESVSTAMCHLAYELAINPDMQQRLKDEIDDVLTIGKKITYEELLKMKYLDCLVAESLRLRPPTPLSDRKSTKPFIIEPKFPDEKPIYLPEGTVIGIPIAAIQSDPEYYPNPTQFDPDRFSDENKHTINPFTYLPFGAGPRNCIGSRFALMEIKLIIVSLIQHFEIIPVQKTVIPIVMSKTSISLLPDDGVWLGLKRRKPVDKI